MIQFTEFQKAYLDCALWSSTDESTEQGGESLDANYGIRDIAPESLAKMLKDCDVFYHDNLDMLVLVGSDAQHGHDFWLTRNGHGAGFWDRDYGQIGDDLTLASNACGTRDLYVGDDDRLYV